MPSRYSFGGYIHTGDFPDVALDDFLGRILFLSGTTRRQQAGQEGFDICMFEQMFCIGIRAGLKPVSTYL